MRTSVLLLVTLALSGAFSSPRIAGAQSGTEAHARALERRAAALAGETTPDSLRRAAVYWGQAADEYARIGLRPRAAAAWDSASRVYDRIGVRDSALTQLGRALAVRDTSITAQVDSLLNTSPLLQPTRSVADEALFVQQVRQLLARIRGRPTAPSEVPSAEAAVAVLEELNAGRETWIDVRTPFPTFDFSFRRWLYRNSRSQLTWDSRTASTRFQASRQTYQFRYTDPRTGRDTIITKPCADSPCIIYLPVSAPPRP